MSDMIACEGLSLTLDGHRLLQDVWCSLPRGSVTAIIGPNGAGKSTFLRCLMRLMPLTSGTVTLDGKNHTAYSRKELARLIGYVPQLTGEAPPYRADEFVLMSRYAHLSHLAQPGPADRRLAMEALALTGAQDLAAQPMGVLSGGERQKVLLAAALAADPAILILDEGMAFLDPGRRLEMRACLARVRESKDLTVVAVTHDLTEALNGPDRVLALRAGRQVFFGTPADLLAQGTLNTLFEVPFTYLRHPVGGAVIPVPEET